MSSLLFLDNSAARLDDERVHVPLPAGTDAQIDVKGPLSFVYAQALNTLFDKKKIAQNAVKQVEPEMTQTAGAESQQQQSEAQILAMVTRNMQQVNPEQVRQGLGAMDSDYGVLQTGQAVQTIITGDNSTDDGFNQTRQLVQAAEHLRFVYVMEAYPERMPQSRLNALRARFKVMGCEYFTEPKELLVYLSKGGYA